MSMPRSAPDARRAALTGLIDYAGLFPPARLPLAEAVAEYRRVKASPDSWFVDRFIANPEPAGRLGEFDGWDLPVSLVVQRDVPEFPAKLHVVMLEFKGEVPDGPLPAPAVIEVDWRDGCAMEARLGELASDDRGLGAKLRCGGLAADMFPPPERVADFMVACRELGLAYKLTAGLHQPFRHAGPETGFTHHGFLNLLAAEVLGRAHDLDAKVVAEIVAEEDPEAFRLGTAAMAWRDLTATADDVAVARREGLLAFGSCDVEEPLAALAASGRASGLL